MLFTLNYVFTLINIDHISSLNLLYVNCYLCNFYYESMILIHEVRKLYLCY